MTKDEIRAIMAAPDVSEEEARRILLDGLHKEILKRDRPAEKLKKLIKELEKK